MDSNIWLSSVLSTLAGYRRMLDAALCQLSDEEFFRRPAEDFNSIAIILRHLGGNLRSRWTDFLTTDGEKPSRDRDLEFEDWPDSRDALMDYFGRGWDCLTSTLASLTKDDLNKSVLIRGESHSVPEAILRSVSHLAYHIGQVTMLARSVHEGEWSWLTIPPGLSKEHNAKTWGTCRARGIGGNETSSPPG